MKLLYLDAYAGISGDMTVAMLLDLGVPLELLQQELAKLALPTDSYTLASDQVTRQGVTGRSFLVQLPHEQHTGQHHGHGHSHHHHEHRSYADIRRMIAESGLSESVQKKAQQIFLKLAEAEAIAHQVSVDEVRFHEVGAVDSIVDIVATAVGLDLLGVEQVYCSAVPLGGGFVETAHGRLPVPAPATALLMRGLQVHGICGSGERVTPTGAAILAALAKSVAAIPAMQMQAIGHGAGSKEFSDCPNILRGFLGEVSEQGADTVLELSCNLDDLTPEVIGYTQQRLLDAGALDVWTTPILMKKQRPAVMLSLLCQPEQQAVLAAILMAESGTLGVRSQTVQRMVQPRQVVEQQTRWGVVRFKQSECRLKPEFDDCCRIAREQGLPLRQVQQVLLQEYDHE